MSHTPTDCIVHTVIHIANTGNHVCIVHGIYTIPCYTCLDGRQQNYSTGSHRGSGVGGSRIQEKEVDCNVNTRVVKYDTNMYTCVHSCRVF